MAGTFQEEDKEDDFERDLTMEVDPPNSDYFSFPAILRKRMSSQVLEEYVDPEENLEKTNSVDCDFFELK
jgi:hypothetical protein